MRDIEIALKERPADHVLRLAAGIFGIVVTRGRRGGLLLRRFLRLGRLFALSRSGQELFLRPVGALTHGDEGSAVFADPLPETRADRFGEIGASAGENDMRVARPVDRSEPRLFHQRHQHMHADVEKVPHLAGVIACEAAVEDEQDPGLHERREGLAAAEVRARRQRVPGSERMHDDAVFRRDLAHDAVRPLRVAGAGGERYEDGAAGEIDRALRRHGAEGRARHACLHPGREQAIERAGRIIIVPGKDIAVACPIGHGCRGPFGVRPRAEKAAAVGAPHRGIVEVEGERHGPAGDVVEDRFGEFARAVEDAPEEHILLLAQGHDIALARPIEPVSHAHVPCKLVGGDVIALEKLKEVQAPGAVGRGEDEGGTLVLRGRRGGVTEELPLMGEEVGTQAARAFDRAQGGAEMGADIVTERAHAVRRLDRTAARGRSLEQDAHRAVHLRIGRALADIVIVEALLAVIEPRFGVENAAVEGRHLLRELPRARRDERVPARRHAGVEIVGRIRAHLVIVDRDIRLPGVPGAHPCLRLGLCLKEPLAVEIEPVVVGPRRDPQIVRGMRRIAHRHLRKKAQDMIDAARMAVGIEDRGD